jgi:release factor glutamine methyltransferase
MNPDLSVSLLESDLFESLEREEFDVIISNPPYIKTRDLETLDDGVKLFEPRVALDGGPDGLYFYREITKNARKFLRPGGMIFFEIGFDQGEAVKEILQADNFADITVIKDYANLDRIVHARKVDLNV